MLRRPRTPKGVRSATPWHNDYLFISKSMRGIVTGYVLVSTWMKAAEVLDAQGEEILAGEVRYFAKHLPPVLTDRQRLATQFLRFRDQRRRIEQDGPAHGYPKDPERTL